MGNLIKMDLYKIRKSKMTYVSVIVMAALTILSNALLPLLLRLADNSEIESMKLSSLIESPYMTTMMFLAVVHFSYMDIAGGYIKNIAGQLPNKGSTVISKFFAIGVHNFVFLALSSAVNGFAGYISYNVETDMDKLPAALATLLIKWLLSMAMCSIILFFTNGIKSGVLGYIAAVIMSFNVMDVAYLGINNALNRLDMFKGIDVSKYAVDCLYGDPFRGNVSVVDGKLVPNGIICGILVTAVFMFVTVYMFNKKDVK